MEIDFHFGVTYAVARLAGFGHEDGVVIATASQYVDDTVNSGVLEFKTGQAFNRISTAHEKSDYHITLSADERLTWVPFHFLPGDDPRGAHEEEFFNRIVCRPNSAVAQAMCRLCIERQDKPHGLHRLGITSHVFIDTWAHQGFAGVNHPVNQVSSIALIDPEDQRVALEMLKHPTVLVGRAVRWAENLVLARAFPMGHGAALHYPDHPFRKWKYKNGHGEVVTRDNPTDFLEAADQLCRFFQRYLRRDPTAAVPGLPASDKALIQKKIGEIQDDAGWTRLWAWIAIIKDGQFSFGSADPGYFDSGPGSWKGRALGVPSREIPKGARLEYAPGFLTSHWKYFHEAALTHQHEVLREILPSFGICAI